MSNAAVFTGLAAMVVAKCCSYDTDGKHGVLVACFTCMFAYQRDIRNNFAMPTNIGLGM